MSDAKEEFEKLPEWLQELWELNPRLARIAEASLSSRDSTPTEGVDRPSVTNVSPSEQDCYNFLLKLGLRREAENGDSIRLHKILSDYFGQTPAPGRAADEGPHLTNACIRCGKEVGNKIFSVCETCWDADKDPKATPTDPKARVVEITLEARDQWVRGTGPTLKEFADRLASEGLLASAPVVPSVETLRALLMKASSFGSVTVDGCEAIRNHLLTLGWREK